uniref:DUF1628-like protein n=1 Tax=Adineta vaga TaxID=104782 RepID=B3G4E3_ADIVA|nr:DUF1628-like protein [Adineta vaga]
MHVAFVFDSSSKKIIIYLNGYNVGQSALATSSTGYVGSSGSVYIAMIPFVGLIDHMTGKNTEDNKNFNNIYIYVSIIFSLVIKRAKCASEILNDATLTAYYSFDSGSPDDDGPNFRNGNIFGGVTTVTGYIGKALSFSSTSTYLRSYDISFISKPSIDFSVALWIKPSSIANGAVIIHLSSNSNGGGFCYPITGLDSSGRIVFQLLGGAFADVVGTVPPLNEWTHIAQTYSPSNGLRLYINGVLSGSTGAFNTLGSGNKMYMYVGSLGPSGSGCGVNKLPKQPFIGAIDELRIYTRELSDSDVWVLANQ